MSDEENSRDARSPSWGSDDRDVSNSKETSGHFDLISFGKEEERLVSNLTSSFNLRTSVNLPPSPRSIKEKEKEEMEKAEKKVAINREYRTASDDRSSLSDHPSDSVLRRSSTRDVEIIPLDLSPNTNNIENNGSNNNNNNNNHDENQNGSNANLKNEESALFGKITGGVKDFFKSPREIPSRSTSSTTLLDERGEPKIVTPELDRKSSLRRENKALDSLCKMESNNFKPRSASVSSTGSTIVSSTGTTVVRDRKEKMRFTDADLKFFEGSSGDEILSTPRSPSIGGYETGSASESDLSPNERGKTWEELQMELNNFSSPPHKDQRGGRRLLTKTKEKIEKLRDSLRRTTSSGRLHRSESKDSIGSSSSSFVFGTPKGNRKAERNRSSLGEDSEKMKKKSPKIEVTNVPSSPELKLSHARKVLVTEDDSEISAETQAKVLATKHFFFEYYWNLFFYLEQREDRYATLKRQLGPHQLIERRTQFFQDESSRLRKRRSRMIANDFQILARIGRGGFGDVFLCRHKKTNQVYAMKRIKRNFIEKTNKSDHIQMERHILADPSEERSWLVRLQFSFQDHKYLYLVMEYVPGGDLRGLMTNSVRFSESDARIYFAEMLEAVLELHGLGFIHRDLKPENFLVSKEGHIKLADFGLSKQGLREHTTKLTDSIRHSVVLGKDFSAATHNFLKFSAPHFPPKDKSEEDFFSGARIRGTSATSNRKLSLVGSPHYMAIEALRGKGYDFTIDLWSLGVIFFELIVGVPPFDGDTPEEIFETVLDYKDQLADAFAQISEEDLSVPARKLITSLICEPEERIGRGGINDFKKLEFFRGFDWTNLQGKKPPFVPKLASEVDHSHFQETVVEGNWLNVSRDSVPDSLSGLKPLPNFSYNNLAFSSNKLKKEAEQNKRN